MAKILIVDDSEVLRKKVRQALETKAHEVVEAEDGMDGLNQLEANEGIQLILCDVNMPKMDGITMCGQVHQNERFNKIPIFMLTTESDPELKAKGKASGVVAWVTKPIAEEKLLMAVDKILSRS